MNAERKPTEQELELGALIREGRRLRPWEPHAQARTWNQIAARARKPKPRRVLIGSLSVGAVTAALVAFALLRTPDAPGDLTQLVVADGAQVTSTLETQGDRPVRKVKLTDGRIDVHGELAANEQVEVTTPHLRVFASAASGFTVVASKAQTDVSVSQGAVRVETATGRFAVLAAGSEFTEPLPLDSIEAQAPARPPKPPDAVDLPPALGPGLTAKEAIGATRCAPGAPSAQRACLEREATRSDLPAQNALFALALLAREQEGAEAARRSFEDYLKRFGGGVFAPEARLGVLEGSLAAGEASRAVRQGQLFLEEFPEDPRADEVRRTLRRLGN